MPSSPRNLIDEETGAAIAMHFLSEKSSAVPHPGGVVTPGGEWGKRKKGGEREEVNVYNHGYWVGLSSSAKKWTA